MFKKTETRTLQRQSSRYIQFSWKKQQKPTKRV